MKSTHRKIGRYEAALRYVWHFKLTDSGKMLGLALGLSGSMGAASLYIPIAHLFCGLAALFTVAFLAGWLWRPRVRVVSAFPEKAVAAQPVRGEYTVINDGRRKAYDISAGLFDLPRALRIAEQAEAVTTLAPGESERLSLTLLPQRRGIYALPALRPFSMFPFNLIRVSGRPKTLAPLLVMPHFHPLASLEVPLGRRYQPGGIALTSHVGDSAEYIGNRDYVPGDPLRHIDFRSWARLAKPCVREFQEEYFCRVGLVLDTYTGRKAPRDAEGDPQVEAAISLAAASADALGRGEYVIDLFAAGPELYVFRAGRQTAHLENILEILACVEACPRNPFDVITPAIADELSSISTLICVLLDWDEARQSLVRTATEAGCSTKVLVVRDGSTTLPLDAAESPIVHCTPEDIRQGGIDVL